MSSGRTENIELCQWERTDPVRMEDFNEDNMKIDAAITAANENIASVAEENAMVKLMDIAVEESGIKIITVNLSGINLSKYATLRINNVSSTGEIFCRINGHTSNYKSLTTGATGIYDNDYCSGVCGFLDISLISYSIHVCDYIYVQWHNSVSASNLNAIQLMANSDGTSNFSVGRKYSLWGIKR